MLSFNNYHLPDRMVIVDQLIQCSEVVEHVSADSEVLIVDFAGAFPKCKEFTSDLLGFVKDQHW